ncbi:uncharacterized protein LOC120342708 [Styela clava]
MSKLTAPPTNYHTPETTQQIVSLNKITRPTLQSAPRTIPILKTNNIRPIFATKIMYTSHGASSSRQFFTEAIKTLDNETSATTQQTTALPKTTLGSQSINANRRYNLNLKATTQNGDPPSQTNAVFEKTTLMTPTQFTNTDFITSILSKNTSQTNALTKDETRAKTPGPKMNNVSGLSTIPMSTKPTQFTTQAIRPSDFSTMLTADRDPSDAPSSINSPTASNITESTDTFDATKHSLSNKIVNTTIYAEQNWITTPRTAPNSTHQNPLTQADTPTKASSLKSNPDVMITVLQPELSTSDYLITPNKHVATTKSTKGTEYKSSNIQSATTRIPTSEPVEKSVSLKSHNRSKPTHHPATTTRKSTVASRPTNSLSASRFVSTFSTTISNFPTPKTSSSKVKPSGPTTMSTSSNIQSATTRISTSEPVEKSVSLKSHNSSKPTHHPASTTRKSTVASRPTNSPLASRFVSTLSTTISNFPTPKTSSSRVNPIGPNTMSTSSSNLPQRMTSTRAKTSTKARTMSTNSDTMTTGLQQELSTSKYAITSTKHLETMKSTQGFPLSKMKEYKSATTKSPTTKIPTLETLKTENSFSIRSTNRPKSTHPPATTTKKSTVASRPMNSQSASRFESTLASTIPNSARPRTTLSIISPVTDSPRTRASTLLWSRNSVSVKTTKTYSGTTVSPSDATKKYTTASELKTVTTSTKYSGANYTQHATRIVPTPGMVTGIASMSGKIQYVTRKSTVIGPPFGENESSEKKSNETMVESKITVVPSIITGREGAIKDPPIAPGASIFCQRRCANGGKCGFRYVADGSSQKQEIYCKCVPGFVGDLCEIEVNSAGSVPPWHVVLIAIAIIFLILCCGILIMYGIYRRHAVGRYDVEKRFRVRPLGNGSLNELTEDTGASRTSLRWHGHDSMTLSSTYSTTASV